MLNKIKEEIKKAKNIVLVGHINPDGDCIGATVAFKYMIESFDSSKNVKVCINDDLPDYVEKLPYLPKIYKEIDGEIDLLISLDVANKERLAIDEKYIKLSKKTIAIDHHISNTKYFDLNYVEDISSASELTYKFLDIFSIKLTKEIATYIYLGIINDTGNFKHNNVTAHTFMVASEIANTGIDLSNIYRILFSKSLKKAELFSKSVLEATFDKELGFMYYYLGENDIYTRNETNGASEYMLGLEEVKVSLFMQQDGDEIKGSFRSKSADVNYIAAQFDGGGHKLASGFKTKKKLDEIIQKTKEILKCQK